jgi:DNA mismatch repair protein MutS
VAFFVADEPRREDLRELLRRTPDLERALARLSSDRGGPRDLARSGDGLALPPNIEAALGDAPSAPDGGRGARLTWASTRSRTAGRALKPEPPPMRSRTAAWSPRADAGPRRARRLRDEGRGVIANLQAAIARETGVDGAEDQATTTCWAGSSRPRRIHAEKMMAPPSPSSTARRMANAVRFTTAELSDLESRILADAATGRWPSSGASSRSCVAQVLARPREIGRRRGGAGRAGRRRRARRSGRQRGLDRGPSVDAIGVGFRIEGGRHPVVEQALAAAAASGPLRRE